MDSCLIIAAGMGTRLSGVGDSKPMVPLLGIPLIIRVIDIARSAGVTDFYVVTGYNAGKIKKTLTRFSVEQEVAIHFIDNDEWEKPNGISVLKARDHIREPFFLLMSDHMFDASILRKLSASSLSGDEVTLAVDTRLKDNPLVDLEDVTKVYEEGGNIVNIGKTIEPYNAFDTGIFYCTPALFTALAESIGRGDASLSGGMKVLAAAGKAKIMDIGDKFWLDVDNEEMLKKAETIIANGL